MGLTHVLAHGLGNIEYVFLNLKLQKGRKFLMPCSHAFFLTGELIMTCV